MQLAYIFGRTPRLALRELEVTATILPFRWSLSTIQAEIARLKPEIESVEGSGSYSHYLDFKDPKNKESICALQARLGGTTRTVYLHKQCERKDVVSELLRMVQAAHEGKEGKLTLGMSVWGNGKVQPFHLAKALKTQLQNDGRSVRFVIPREGAVLSTAQVVHNRLAYFPEEGKRMELVAIEEQGQWWIGMTLTVQDIESYTKRDFSIPFPDPVSGMLSPKLAQTMVNLAVQGEKATVYDPFCGNGRVVLESWLMGLTAYGSDIVEEKVTAAQKNLQWLAEEYHLDIPNTTDLFWTMDATQPAALKAADTMEKPWHIVGEPYLGKPLRAKLLPTEKEAWLTELLPLYLDFFQLWSNAPKRPDSMLIVIPRAKVSDGSEASVYEQIVDRLREIGYTPEVLFCYDRPDSFVRRDLVRISYTK